MTECPSAGGEVERPEVPHCLEEHELVCHSAKMLADLLWPNTVHVARRQFRAYADALCRARRTQPPRPSAADWRNSCERCPVTDRQAHAAQEGGLRHHTAE